MYLLFVFKQNISAYLQVFLWLQILCEFSFFLLLFDFLILLSYLFTNWKTVPTNKMSTFEFFYWFDFNQESFLIDEVSVSNVKSLTTKKARPVVFLMNLQFVILLEVSYKIVRLVNSRFLMPIYLLSDFLMLLMVNFFGLWCHFF